MRLVTVEALVLAATFLVGCPGSKSTKCSWGDVCAPGQLCHQPSQSCVLPVQIAVCDALGEGDTCTFPGAPGDWYTCQDGVCLADARCGDGVQDEGEACDDGNVLGGDGCSADCLSDETCGNGFVDAVNDETCDCGTDPESLSGECLAVNGATDSDCSETCRSRFCGNHVVDPGEVCDDGNSESGDSCSADCQSDETCGNDYVDLAAGEQCDDGEDNSDTTPDACRTDCTAAWCGDGVTDIAEVCDDNNNTSGDSCSADCLSDETCGNGYVDLVTGEECDDSTANSDMVPDACRTDCSSPSCGDGVVDTGEQCDDGPANSDLQPDACRTNCLLAHCGDLIVDSGEDCDEGTLNSVVPNATCRTNCLVRRCGDGIRDDGYGEVCDATDLGGQDCSTFGFVDPVGLACAADCREDLQPCTATCGNAIREPSEGCDDGNTYNWDGCNALCEIEGCIVFVNNDPAITQRDGRSWQTALDDVGAAITVAAATSVPCDVWVAEGTYHIYQTAPTDTVQLAEDVGVYGGFTGSEYLRGQRDWETHTTTLDGAQAGNPSNRVYHVVTGASYAVLDGFTVTGGAATGTDPHNYGGGMYSYPASFITVANCTFTGNTASSGGGGMYNRGGSPSVTRCAFTGNTATGGIGGGGMYNRGASPTVTDCLFSGNSGGYGGAMLNNDGPNPIITRCTFVGNGAGYGGGIHNTNSHAEVTDCLFIGNTAGWGGGIYNNNCTATVTRCVFARNSASTRGGGMSHFEDAGANVTDCTFVGNTAVGRGGGMNIYQRSWVLLKGCTFSGNSSDYGGGFFTGGQSTSTVEDCAFAGNLGNVAGGGMCYLDSSPSTITGSIFTGNQTPDGGGLRIVANAAADVTSSILWGDSAPESSGAGFTFAYSDVQDATPTGAGNISQDPLLTAGPASPLFSGTWISVTYDATSYQTELVFDATTLTPGAVSGNGLYVRPDLTDPRWFVIADNTATSLRVWGDLTVILPTLATGSSYEVYDIHLAAGSPCIDTAHGETASATDLDGNQRVDDLAAPNGYSCGALVPPQCYEYADMGAFEHQP